MTVKEAIALLFQKITFYLQSKFTGKIEIVINCKDGGIGNISLSAKQNFSKKDVKYNDKNN